MLLPEKRPFAPRQDALFFVIQGSTDGCAEFGMFRNMEVDAIELLEHRVDVLALGQQCQVADEYEVLDAGIKG